MPPEREPSADRNGETPARSFEARAFSPPLRAICAGLRIFAAGNIAYLAAHLALDLIQGSQTAPPIAVALGVIVLSGAPWIGAALLRRAVKATVSVEPSEVVITLRRAQYRVPIASITEVRALALPLPGPGVALVLKSGRLFRYRLEFADPAAFLSALPVPSAAGASAHPSVAFGRERSLLVRRGWLFRLVKHGLFPLAFAILFFRLHQYIVFGGPFGQYRLFGLAAYLRSFGVAWAGTWGQLFVYACSARLVAEMIAFSITWAAPSRAHSIRRAAEISIYLAYFGLIPAYVASLFLR